MLTRMPKHIKNKQKNGMIERFKKGKFWEGLFILLFNSRLKLFLGKLKSIWSSLFTVHKVFPHGAVELKNNTSGDTFKINGKRLKSYHQGQEVGLVEEAQLRAPYIGHTSSYGR